MTAFIVIFSIALFAVVSLLLMKRRARLDFLDVLLLSYALFFAGSLMLDALTASSLDIQPFAFALTWLHIALVGVGITYVPRLLISSSMQAAISGQTLLKVVRGIPAAHVLVVS